MKYVETLLNILKAAFRFQVQYLLNKAKTAKPLKPKEEPSTNGTKSSNESEISRS